VGLTEVAYDIARRCDAATPKAIARASPSVRYEHFLRESCRWASMSETPEANKSAANVTGISVFEIET